MLELLRLNKEYGLFFFIPVQLTLPASDGDQSRFQNYPACFQTRYPCLDRALNLRIEEAPQWSCDWLPAAVA